ncbi:phage tail protein [Paenibacillus arenilitoris]|uniref:Phage tail protein n=1 Tax=Paenibacillus arenilitoris TaxID=2772299 RepID=A0A927CKT9_9BACL|nr:tail fiber protein [Paenibacillus arenilitoris]MBD2867716.1 phage tail protein [Paenibacillus arenilitoris]
MSEPYIGEIRAFAGNFAPKGWALCNGQLLPISHNTALFSILGVTYGGDGKTNFALPDLMGKAPLQQGAGVGLTPRTLGEIGGSPSVTLTTNEIPAHTHAPQAVNAGSTLSPTNATWAGLVQGRGIPTVYASNPTTPMSPNAVGVTGGSQPHNNRQPYLGVNFIIALEGIFPPRP